MKRHSLGATKYLSVLLALASGAVLAGDQATGELQQPAAQAYTYSDDWAVVSAPPPQGPYNAINLDPRLPGQDLVAPMPMPEADTPEVPVTSAAASAPEGPASAPGASGSTSATASAPRQSSVPPQTPYDYQPQPALQGQPAQVQDSVNNTLACRGSPVRVSCSSRIAMPMDRRAS
ncbi:MAG: hypothetical protein OEM43_02400 [Gammaproteobacteria bacterium]|nr:hypothetical protein [Gammaproteobacteria bacterium]